MPNSRSRNLLSGCGNYGSGGYVRVGGYGVVSVQGGKICFLFRCWGLKGDKKISTYNYGCERNYGVSRPLEEIHKACKPESSSTKEPPLSHHTIHPPQTRPQLGPSRLRPI